LLDSLLQEIYELSFCYKKLTYLLIAFKKAAELKNNSSHGE